MTIKTETDHAGTDLNDVIGILHKQLERGYVGPSQAIALAELISRERERAIAPFLALADEWQGRGQGVAGWYGDHYRSLADSIRSIAEEAS